MLNLPDSLVNHLKQLRLHLVRKIEAIDLLLNRCRHGFPQLSSSRRTFYELTIPMAQKSYRFNIVRGSYVCIRKRGFGISSTRENLRRIKRFPRLWSI
jgi:hypothetical protein